MKATHLLTPNGDLILIKEVQQIWIETVEESSAEAKTLFQKFRRASTGTKSFVVHLDYMDETGWEWNFNSLVAAESFRNQLIEHHTVAADKPE